VLLLSRFQPWKGLYMHQIPGEVAKKVAQASWSCLRNWFQRNRALQKQVESLQAQLAEERSGKLMFKALMDELVCLLEDDNMYWRKDGSGGPYCPLCLCDNQKLIPLIHGSEGCYYCGLHKQFFTTQERRTRRSNYVPQPRGWRAMRERLEAESYSRAQRNGANT
jgi:hypothetical protein